MKTLHVVLTESQYKTNLNPHINTQEVCQCVKYWSTKHYKSRFAAYWYRSCMNTCTHTLTLFFFSTNSYTNSKHAHFTLISSLDAHTDTQTDTLIMDYHTGLFKGTASFFLMHCVSGRAKDCSSSVWHVTGSHWRTHAENWNRLRSFSLFFLHNWLPFNSHNDWHPCETRYIVNWNC